MNTSKTEDSVGSVILPPLPEKSEIIGHHTDHVRLVVIAYGYTAEQMEAYARQAALAERERCLKIVDAPMANGPRQPSHNSLADVFNAIQAS